MKKLIALTFFALTCLSMQAGMIISPAEPPVSDTNEVAKAEALHKKVVDEDRIISSLSEALAVTLPQGLSKKIGNQNNIIVIESMSFSPQGAKLTAYMSAEVPKSEEKIALKGKDINFAPGGFTGGARLELMEDVDIKLGKNMTMVLKGGIKTSKTFVECDCKGYKEMGLQGEIQFSRNKLVPEGPDGNIIADTTVKVKAPFETKIIGWDDFMLEVGITPFQVKDMKDFSFSVNSAVFDFSEVANAPSMAFPEAYESSDFIDGNRNMWKGFFLKDLVVKLPKNLSKRDSTRSIIEAHDLLIDNIGLSGKFLGTNIFSRDQADMSKWEFSLDTISAEISKNQLVECGFNGFINIPIMGDSTVLHYDAFIDPGNQYTFIVTTTDTLKMDRWMAKLRLDPNSYVDISVIEGKFRPKAVLNGRLAITTKKIELADVEFEELTITPEAPYIKAKAFSFGSEYAKQKLGKFPISVTSVGIKTIDDRTGINFDLNLNLTGEQSGGFAGETSLSIFAKSYEENNRQRWKYDGFEVSKIAIDLDGGAFKLKGSAQWFKKDPVYGDGFSGNIEAEFKMFPRLTATALFGNINGLRYWYADAMVNFNSGVPLFSEAIKLYGFGGGAYHHMSQLGWEEKSSSTIGKTASGIIYKPDKDTFLGLKATINLGSSSKTLFNSDLTFEMVFNDSAGVDRMIFRGNGYFMTPKQEGGFELSTLKNKCKDIAKGKEPNVMENKDAAKSSLYAFVNLDFDFKNDIMHGNLGAYINVGNGVLQGIGPGGKAGEAVMYFAKDEWYIYIGTPSDRLGVKALKFAQLDAYFMMGTKIPSSPKPPAKVSEILGGIDLDYMANENAIGKGKGIGFGAGLQFNTGHKTFGPFYADFDAGAGFDVMLKNYGVVNCKGQSEPLGINGWYANGQVWAYIEGAIGVEVNWRFIHGKYEIIRVGAAAVLQAKLPNPFWMRGVIGGRYSILGGMVSGNCRFDFTVGEECEIEGGGSPVQGIEVIAEATPNDGSTDVNVFNAAQAVFNMPIGKVFELENLDGKNVAFKIELDHFIIADGKNVLQGELEWNAEKDVLAFDSHEILPPEKQLNLEVQVSFKEKKYGSWQTVMADGQKVIESLKTTFTTGEAPDYIPMNNVKYSYPLPMMFNYYQNETNIGYIQLDDGQEYLFMPGAEWKQIGRFVDKQGNKHEFDFSYNATDCRVNFTRPGSLQNNTIYSFELVNVPVQSKAAIDKNVTAKVEKKDLKLVGQKDEDVSTMEIKTKDAEGNLTQLQEKNIFDTHFRTSKYNTLSAKINNLTMGTGSQWPLRARVHLIYLGIDDGERFTTAEVNGTSNYEPIVQFTNELTNHSWYKNLISPYLYENYPIEGFIGIKNRVSNPVGLPPIHTVTISQSATISILTDEEVQTGVSNANIGPAAFHSYLIHYVANDYTDLATQVCTNYYGQPNISSKLSYLITTAFPVVRPGVYTFKVKYVLPGLNQETSSKPLTITLE